MKGLRVPIIAAVAGAALSVASPGARADEAPPPEDASRALATDVPTSVLDHLANPSPTSFITAAMVLRVADPQEAVETLVKEAQAAGGYLSSRDDFRVELRIPTGRAGAFLGAAGALGKVSERTYTVTDHAQEVARLDASLKARREVLDRYFQLVGGADPQGVLTVERELRNLTSEVETMAGRRRLLMHQLAYAQVVVAFRYVDRQAPESSATSSFGWINEMNLDTVLGAFRFRRGYR